MRTKFARTSGWRPLARAMAVVGAGVAAVLVPAVARGQQIDVNPPLPNVLLLIDNSGSMDRMIDGTLPESQASTTCNCDPSSGACNFSAQPLPNRWGVLLQALTGTFQNGYNCAAMPRTPGSVFASEYQINGVNPYDVNYYIPFHRPIVEDTQTNPLTPLPCVYAPGALPGASTPNGVGPQGIGAGGQATDFPSTALVQHTYGTSNTKTCVFAQQQDGALDSELDIMRFGLMTFDQDPSAATGTTQANLVAAQPFAGMWSYFPGWNTGAACNYLGAPANCSTQTMLAVGARNPAAPPWEGRMVPLPATTDIATQETQNQRIQQVLLASRPYGATPLAGMFTGAQYYLQNDPTGPQQSDSYVRGGCRKEYIILLTDGAPNLDMRPQCATSGNPQGVCPFLQPDAIATALATPSSGAQAVTTYVIGFAVSSFQDQGATIYCSNLVTNGQLSSQCSSTDPAVVAKYGACCELQKIAVAGGTGQAYFADTPGDLQNALGTILSAIAKNTTTRTVPAYSPIITNVLADPNAPTTNSSLYLASFNPTPGRPWSGDVQRQRFQCTFAAGTAAGTGSYTVAAPTPNISSGDDFAANLNSGAGPQRTFVVLQPDPLSGAGGVNSLATIRPYVLSNVGDGLGKYGATTYSGAASAVTPSISPAAVGVTSDQQCTYNPTGGGAATHLTALQCRDLVFDYTLGVPTFSSGPGNFPFVSRSGNAFGDVFHATPVVVGPPGSLLRDDSYVGFRSTYANRKQVVYAATNDGLLHAFWADETKLENNELWALMPPAVMPNLLSSYPSSHEFLLDGSPVVKDVVWDRSLANQGDPTSWHTTLVASFGPSQQGYYAVDVTNPDTTGMASSVVPTDPPPVGPVFLWQLTKMPATNQQLFGAHGGTPAVTSVFVDPGDGKGAREIGIAILPGGQDSGPTSTASTGGCARALKATDSAPINAFTARTAVRCWGANHVATDAVVGRSLSIVRLDTGEILRVFIRAADLSGVPQDTLNIAKRVTDTSLDSPMTGVPAVFPADVGADATKVFVGDADGTMWRFDLSSSDPSKWFGELYLDLYNQDPRVDGNQNSWADGQPVQLSPVVSLDPAGNVVVNVATGTQETFDTTGMYFVYSITELVQGSQPKLRASVNWWLNPTTITNKLGERVSGPMTVFDGVLYYVTYAAAPQGTQSCTSGDARLWGRDFVLPKDATNLALGGVPRMQAPPGQPPGTPDFIQPDLIDPTLAGVVIPGVSVKATPACAGSGTAGADSFVYGAQHAAPQNFSGGSYSLYTQVGAKGTAGTSTRQYELQLPTPAAPTMIDSWAAVIE